MKRFLGFLLLFVSLTLSAYEREAVWPKGKMPDAQKHQIAAMTNEVKRMDSTPTRSGRLIWSGSKDRTLPFGTGRA